MISANNMCAANRCGNLGITGSRCHCGTSACGHCNDVCRPYPNTCESCASRHCSNTCGHCNDVCRPYPNTCGHCNDVCRPYPNTCESCTDNCGSCGSCYEGGTCGIVAQLRTLYNARVQITTFTCVLDVVVLDLCGEFIRVLDYCTGKIFLLRVDCICMIEQPIMPAC